MGALDGKVALVAGGDPRGGTRHRGRARGGRGDGLRDRPERRRAALGLRRGRRRSRRPRRWSPSSAARGSPSGSTTWCRRRWRRSSRGSATSAAGSTSWSTTSGAASGCSSGTRRSGSTTSANGLRLLRQGIDTHLITAHHALPLLIARPGGLLVEVTDGTAAYNAEHYRLSVFYDLVKTAATRMAWAHAKDLAPHGGDGGGGHAGLDALGDDARRPSASPRRTGGTRPRRSRIS